MALVASLVASVHPAGGQTLSAASQVFGPLGSFSTSEKTAAASVSPASALTVSLSLSTSVGYAPLTINATAAAGGGSGPYSVRICPGTTACENAASWTGTPWTVAHTFDTPGNYTVSVAVTDSAGTNSIAQQTVTVLVVQPVAATPLLSATTGAAPFTIQFDAVASGGVGPYSMTWSFGDGNSATGRPGQSLNHTYNSTGTFHPALTVTDSRGTQLVRATPAVVVTPPTRPNQLSVAGVAIPWSVVGAVAGVAVVGSVTGYAAYYRRLRRESMDLVQALWEGNAPPSEPDERT